MRRLVLITLLLALTGCVTLPESGPVKGSPSSAQTAAAAPFDYRPNPPRPGASPDAVVAGFLDAMQETPLTYTVARQFLTEERRTRWQPSRRTVIYPDGGLETTIRGDQATVTLASGVVLDARGSWRGDPTGGAGQRFGLHLTREGDEWRISDAPDALIIPRSHFDTRFVRYNLHFFDPTGTVLVPEPVYLPAGVQAPSLLVSALLAGPDRRLRSVERTFFPVGTHLDLSVPVSDGVADVPLSSELLDADTAQLDLAMAQLAWTLRQVPGIDRMRVTVDGTPVDRTTGASARSLLGWSAYDPSAPGDTDLFAVRDGNVVAESDGDEETVSSAFRSDPIRSLGVAASGQEFLGVTRDGSRVLAGAAQAVQGRSNVPRLAYSGTDVLRPAWDVFGCAWLVDRTPAGAHLSVLWDGRVRRIQAPGISGRDVVAFEVSRDGTRLAAVVDGDVLLARISRRGAGRPTRVQRAETLPVETSDTDKIVDLAWTTTATLGVLVRSGTNISQVLRASVDGSFALNGVPTSLEPLFEPADNIVAWPGADAPVYLQARSGRMYVVSSTGHWNVSGLPGDMLAPTFTD